MRKRFWVTLIAALATISCAASARAETGLSYLALCSPSWSCQESLAAFQGKRVIRTGWLETTFGESCPCAKTLLEDRRRKEIRVHIANYPCVRNARCGPYEPFAGETPESLNRKILARDPVILGRFTQAALRLKRRLEASRGGLTCYVSPCLECQLDDRARATLFALTVGLMPDCMPVDSILSGRCLPGTVCEKHGEAPTLRAPCISDLDGVPLERVSVEKFLADTRQCDMSLLWTYSLNCNGGEGSPFIDPRRRDCRQGRAFFEALGKYLN